MNPVVVMSKGRAGKSPTLDLLAREGITHEVVAYWHEAERYAQAHPKAEVVRVGTDITHFAAKRQWILQRARSLGWGFFWMLDDDIKGFYRYGGNGKADRSRVGVREALESIEETAKEFPAVGMAGPDYQQFAWRARTPFTVNRGVYVAALLRTGTGIDFREELRNKADVGYVLDHITQGWATLLMHTYAMETQVMATGKGGLQDEYQAGLQTEMSKRLVELFPEMCALHNKGPRGYDVRIKWEKSRK